MTKRQVHGTPYFFEAVVREARLLAAMRAVGFRRFGGPEQVELMELPRPVAQEGEVVVKVAAATVNPGDLKMLRGQKAAAMNGLPPPFIAGMEFAGRVDHVGSSESRLKAGQVVMGIVNPREPRGGAHAEYVCVPAASVVHVPEGVGLIEAATVPMNGLTAKTCVDALDLPPGAVLLVTGGAGALGGYVIQLARKSGLRVVAVASDDDRDLLGRLGADDVVCRGEGMFEAVRALHPSGVDGLVDAAVIGERATALVRDGGAVASVRKAEFDPRDRFRLVEVGVLQRATDTAALLWLAERVREGTLLPRIALARPIEKAVEAYADVERGGLRGRVVLVFDETQVSSFERQT